MSGMGKAAEIYCHVKSLGTGQILDGRCQGNGTNSKISAVNTSKQNPYYLSLKIVTRHWEFQAWEKKERQLEISLEWFHLREGCQPTCPSVFFNPLRSLADLLLIKLVIFSHLEEVFHQWGSIRHPPSRYNRPRLVTFKRGYKGCYVSLRSICKAIAFFALLTRKRTMAISHLKIVCSLLLLVPSYTLLHWIQVWEIRCLD